MTCLFNYWTETIKVHKYNKNNPYVALHPLHSTLFQRMRKELRFSPVSIADSCHKHLGFCQAVMTRKAREIHSISSITGLWSLERNPKSLI